jgi:hypothetical protein
MSILTSPSGAFPTSLIYITVGTLVDIWTIVSFVFYPPETNWGRFLVVGFMVSGFALLIIGLLLGRIGRAARHAEMPPAEATPAAAQTEQVAAAHPPTLVPASNGVLQVPASNPVEKNAAPQAQSPLTAEMKR